MFNVFEIQIEKLQEQINELKKEVENFQTSNPQHAVINARIDH
jgi:cell division septum initiation protein DivIVA